MDLLVGSRRTHRGAARAAWLVALLLLSDWAGGTWRAEAEQGAAAEIEEEDLPVFGEEPVAEGEEDKRLELQRMFDEAEEMFRSAQQPRAIPLFTDLVSFIEKLAASRELGTEERLLLIRSFFHRAEAQFNLGENAAAEADLRRLIEMEPGYQVDTALVSPKLARLLEGLRNQMVGYVAFSLQPEDAEVWVDGEEVELLLGATVALLSGEHDLEVQRLGYEPVARALDVRAGKRSAVNLSLERVSAVVRITTRPSEADVLLDGEVVGTTTGVAPLDFLPEGEAARYPPEEFSAQLAIEGLSVGEHIVEVQKAAYRPRRLRVVVEELRDHYLAPVLLEAAAGTVALSGVPLGVEVTVDGKPQSVDDPVGGELQLSLPPGDHTLVVTRGTIGRFEHRFSLADRQTLEMAVSLRSSVSLLGVLGGDRVAAETLLKQLSDSFAAAEAWALANCVRTGPDLLQEVGVEVQIMRQVAELGPATKNAPDWEAVQGASDEQCPGSVYLVGVLSDDLYANEADLWVWSSAPGPARPERRRIGLQGSRDLARFVAAFTEPLNVTRAWLGAQVVDSAAAEAPVVVEVVPEGPAAKAGLQVGDSVALVDGAAQTTSGSLVARVGGAQPDSTLQLEVRGPAGVRSAEVKLEPSPAVISLEDPNLLYPVVSAKLTAELERARGVAPQWVLRLNQAAVLLRGREWREAVKVLRTIQAPAGAGLGQGAVDYWLGVALLATDPGTYGESARTALLRAAGVSGARLYHNDGPLVAPRARARLEELGGSR
jgi:hypothetical protein